MKIKNFMKYFKKGVLKYFKNFMKFLNISNWNISTCNSTYTATRNPSTFNVQMWTPPLYYGVWLAGAQAVHNVDHALFRQSMHASKANEQYQRNVAKKLTWSPLQLMKTRRTCRASRQSVAAVSSLITALVPYYSVAARAPYSGGDPALHGIGEYRMNGPVLWTNNSVLLFFAI